MAADLSELSVILTALQAREEFTAGQDEQPIAVGGESPSLTLVE